MLASIKNSAFSSQIGLIQFIHYNTVKSHWISLNNCIISNHENISWHQVNIHKVKQWMTLITVRCCQIRQDSDFYNNVVYCIKSMNSCFMKHFLVLNWLFPWQCVFINTYLISTSYRVVEVGVSGADSGINYRGAPCIDEGSGTA